MKGHRIGLLIGFCAALPLACLALSCKSASFGSVASDAEKTSPPGRRRRPPGRPSTMRLPRRSSRRARRKSDRRVGPQGSSRGCRRGPREGSGCDQGRRPKAAQADLETWRLPSGSWERRATARARASGSCWSRRPPHNPRGRLARSSHAAHAEQGKNHAKGEADAPPPEGATTRAPGPGRRRSRAHPRPRMPLTTRSRAPRVTRSRDPSTTRTRMLPPGTTSDTSSSTGERRRASSMLPARSPSSRRRPMPRPSIASGPRWKRRGRDSGRPGSSDLPAPSRHGQSRGVSQPSSISLASAPGPHPAPPRQASLRRRPLAVLVGAAAEVPRNREGSGSVPQGMSGPGAREGGPRGRVVEQDDCIREVDAPLLSASPGLVAAKGTGARSEDRRIVTASVRLMAPLSSASPR
jgi:hypothetical protein